MPKVQENNCVSTATFSKKINWYFKYYRQYFANTDDLQKGFTSILESIRKRNFQFNDADEYYSSNNFGDISPKLFKEYKVFDSGNLYFIFVICEQCVKNIRCRSICTKNPKTIVCFYDIWIKHN